MYFNGSGIWSCFKTKTINPKIKTSASKDQDQDQVFEDQDQDQDLWNSVLIDIKTESKSQDHQLWYVELLAMMRKI